MAATHICLADAVLTGEMLARDEDDKEADGVKFRLGDEPCSLGCLDVSGSTDHNDGIFESLAVGKMKERHSPCPT